MYWVFIVLTIISVDQWTKIFIERSMILGESTSIIEGVAYITYWRNKGAAWGILQNGRLFFILLTIVACVFIAYYITKRRESFLRISLSFIMGGATGNLIDRVLRGEVVDFVDIRFGSYHYPIFNLADSFIVIGSILLSYFLIFIYKDENEAIKK